MNDSRGTELKVGDTVLLVGTVTHVGKTAVTVQLVDPNPNKDTSPPALNVDSTICTKTDPLSLEAGRNVANAAKKAFDESFRAK